MHEHAYDSEALLQALLAKYPNLLARRSDGQHHTAALAAGYARGSHSFVRWGGARWAVDHLFLDQDAVPTIVEVKRSSDTRIRREVVGQLLEYAANAVVYWPMETMRARYEANCGVAGTDPQQALQDLIGPDGDAEQFWHLALPPDSIARRPSFKLAVLGDGSVRTQFLHILDWVVGEVRAA